MLTALVSLLSGLFSGALPELLKELRDTRAAKRERDFMEMQHRFQMEQIARQAEDKMREADSLYAAEEIKAMRESLTAIVEAAAKPTGIPWIDGFSALLRPVVCTGVMVLFFWVAFVYVHGVMDAYAAKKLTVEALNAAIWGSMVGEGIVAVMSFLFGYRSGVKVAK